MSGAGTPTVVALEWSGPFCRFHTCYSALLMGPDTCTLARTLAILQLKRHLKTTIHFVGTWCVTKGGTRACQPTYCCIIT